MADFWRIDIGDADMLALHDDCIAIDDAGSATYGKASPCMRLVRNTKRRGEKEQPNKRQSVGKSVGNASFLVGPAGSKHLIFRWSE